MDNLSNPSADTSSALLMNIPLIALIFLIFDCLFLGVNVVWAMLELVGIAGARWNFIKIHYDYGLPEISNFIKYLSVVGLLLLSVPSRTKRVWLPIAGVFLYLFLDDAFRIHENVSDWIGVTFLQGLTEPGKEASTVGQLPFYAILAPTLFGLAWLSIARSDQTERPLAKQFFILLVLLAFFAAGVDFVNSYIIEAFGVPWMGSIGSLIENGAELFITSLCVWTAVLVTRLYQSTP